MHVYEYLRMHSYEYIRTSVIAPLGCDHTKSHSGKKIKCLNSNVYMMKILLTDARRRQ